MNDPKRWAETDAGADSWEQAILRSELEARAPNGASALVWGKLATELGLAGALVGLAAPPTTAPVAGATNAAVGGQALVKAGATWLAFAKGVCVGILGSATAWSGWQLSKTSESAAPNVAAGSSTQPQVRAAPSVVSRMPVTPEPVSPPKAVASVAPLPVTNTSPEPSPEVPRALPAAPTSAAFEPPSAEDAKSALAEQARLLRMARNQLKNGELASAAVTLQEARSRSGAATLSQEREALDIELLYRQGERALASARARTFLAAHPESPHAPRVRIFAGP